MAYIVTPMQEKLLKIYEKAKSVEYDALNDAIKELFPGERMKIARKVGATRGFLGPEGQLIKPIYTLTCGPDSIAIFKDGTAKPC